MSRPSEKIISDVLNDLASKKDAKLVAEWFATEEGWLFLSQQMDKDFIEIKEGYEELVVNHDIPSDKMFRFIMKRIQKKRRRRIFRSTAAVLLPFILISGLFYQVNSKVDLFGKTDFSELYIPKGERVQLLFQDGSQAYINSDTKIRYPKQFGLSERKIYLEGEAYFIVNPNANRPFVVELDNASIAVLGTSFNVKAYADEKDVNVTLDEGRVNLIPWTKKDNILNTGERLIFNKESGECKIIKAQDTKPVSVWKNDIITFKDEPLAEVIKTLNRWYNIDFVVEDEEVYIYSYTMTSENTLLEKTLSDLEKVGPVKFIYEDKVVRLRME